MFPTHCHSQPSNNPPAPARKSPKRNRELTLTRRRVFALRRYKFSIRVPASSALSDRCKNGRIIYHTTATLVGSGSMFKPDITARKESWVMCNPQDEDRSES